MFIARFLPRLFFAGIIAKAILFLLLEIFAFAIHNYFYSKGKSFFSVIRKIFLQAFFLASLKLVLYSMLLYAFRFCFQKESMVFYLLAIVILWFFFFIHFSFLCFFAIFEKNVNSNFLLNLKNSFKEFISKPKTIIILFGKNFILLLISPFTLFLYPSFTGMILNIQIKEN